MTTDSVKARIYEKFSVFILVSIVGTLIYIGYSLAAGYNSDLDSARAMQKWSQDCNSDGGVAVYGVCLDKSAVINIK